MKRFGFKRGKNHPKSQKNKFQALSQSILLKKYRDRFSFFESKTIKIILEETPNKICIDYKEMLIMNSTNMLKRFYKTKEIDVRITNYSKYYAEVIDYNNPTMIVHSQRKIMFKNKRRKYKSWKRMKGGRKNKDLARNKIGCFLDRLYKKTFYLKKIKLSGSLMKDQKKWEKN